MTKKQIIKELEFIRDNAECNYTRENLQELINKLNI